MRDRSFSKIKNACTAEAITELVALILTNKLEQIGVDENGTSLYIASVGEEGDMHTILFTCRKTKRLLPKKGVRAFHRSKHGRRRVPKKSVDVMLVHVKTTDALKIAEEWRMTHRSSEMLDGKLRRISALVIRMSDVWVFTRRRAS